MKPLLWAKHVGGGGHVWRERSNLTELVIQLKKIKSKAECSFIVYISFREEADPGKVEVA